MTQTEMYAAFVVVALFAYQLGKQKAAQTAAPAAPAAPYDPMGWLTSYTPA